MNNTNITKSSLIIAAFVMVMAIPVIVSASAAPATGGADANAAVAGTGGDAANAAFVAAPITGGDGVDSTVIAPPVTRGDRIDASAVAPITGGDGVDSTVIPPPATGGGSTSSASDRVITRPPATGGADASAAAAAVRIPPATGGGSTSSAAAAAPSPIVVPPSGGGSSSSGSSGSYVGSNLILTTYGTSSCPLITTYMKIGGMNDASQVTKLQSFLKNSQGINVAVNGIFDQQTEVAVRAFQSKYMTEVMGPWNATQTTGTVYITTQKLINKLACNIPLVLTPVDSSIIDAYKSRATTAVVAGGAVVAPVGPVLETGTNTATPDAITNSDSSQTGAVGNTSIVGRVWNFFLGLFR